MTRSTNRVLVDLSVPTALLHICRTYVYIYILYLYITLGCIQYRECTQVEPTRQVRANRPTQAVFVPPVRSRQNLFTFPPPPLFLRERLNLFT
jgi:hypothetical protein